MHLFTEKTADEEKAADEEKTDAGADGAEKSNKGRNSKENVKEKDAEATCHITDDDIYMDSFDEKSSDDGKQKKKKEETK